MKLLLTGSQGQVGAEIAALAPSQGWDLLALHHKTLDITDPDAVNQCMARFQPDIVINAAAFTAVDQAETHATQAFAVNRDGAMHLATACVSNHCKLLHLSTDYLFDGQKTTPYLETDPPAPQGVYGASKWAGEQAIQSICEQHLIIRISWVFGLHGNNFLKTMLRLAHEKETLSIVHDQQGGPTPAKATAWMLLNLAQQATKASFADWGLYHYCGTPPVSWYEFADFILTNARRLKPLRIQQWLPITTAEYPTLAQRPANSVLDCHRIQTRLGIQPPNWQLHAQELLQRILA